MATLPTTVRDDALTLSTDLAQSQVAQGAGQGAGGNNNGQSDPRHSCQGNSGEHGGRPVPSFWNFADDDQGHSHLAKRGHHHFETMWHHA